MTWRHMRWHEPHEAIPQPGSERTARDGRRIARCGNCENGEAIFVEAMTRLPDFLLARIAEDEAMARQVVASNVDLFRVLEASGDPTTGSQLEEANQGSEYLVGARPSRVLAECEIKRRIVARKPRLNAHDGDRDVWWDFLALLALPYADHPDYDETWRP